MRTGGALRWVVATKREGFAMRSCAFTNLEPFPPLGGAPMSRGLACTLTRT